MHPHQRFDDLPMPQQAGILCNDPRFQTFAARRIGWPGKELTPGAAAEYLRQCCHITTRAELATNPDAQTRFQTLRTEFDAWTGRIANPR